MTQSQFVPRFGPQSVASAWIIPGLGKGEAEEMAARLIAIAARFDTWRPITAIELVEQINQVMAESAAASTRNREVATRNAEEYVRFWNAKQRRFFRSIFTFGIYSWFAPRPIKPVDEPLEPEIASFCRTHGLRAIADGIFYLLRNGYLTATGIPAGADSFVVEDDATFSFTEKFFRHLVDHGLVQGEMAGQPA